MTMPRSGKLALLASLFTACSIDAGSPAADTDVAPADTEGSSALTSPAATVAQYFLSTYGLDLAHVYWGDMHTHTYYSQDAAINEYNAGAPSVATPATVYAQARARGFSFSAVADHAEAPVPAQITDGSANVWESTRAMSNAANDEVADANGLFIPFMGFEYTNPFPCTDSTPGDGKNECPGDCTSAGGNESCVGHGHKNVIFRSIAGAPQKRISFLDPASWTATGNACTGNHPDTRCGFSAYTSSAPSNNELWATLHANHYDAATSANHKTNAVTIIHTPGNIHHNDWNVTDSELVRSVEIFSQWGNSEGAAPSTCANQNDVDVSIPASEIMNDPTLLIRPQLQQHWIVDGNAAYALGIVGGSDDHTGFPGGNGNGNGGITGILTPAPGRDAFYDALLARHTIAATYYSSTGAIPLLFAVDTGSAHLLGGDIGAVGSDGSATIYAMSTAQGTTVMELQIVVDGCTIKTSVGTSQKYTVTGLSTTSRHYIYVRARRSTTSSDTVDGNKAATGFNQTWSSPVYLEPTG